MTLWLDKSLHLSPPVRGIAGELDRHIVIHTMYA